MRTTSAMFGTAITALSLAAIAFSPVKAEGGDTGHESAIEACSVVNPFQPVEALGAVDDGSGIGFRLSDNEERVWMCDADAEGFVYTYTLMTSDLLEGAGPGLIGLTQASAGGYEDQPQAVAEKVCVAYLGDDAGTVLSNRPDGLDADPGYVIFVESGAGDLYLCNATGDAVVWAFEPVGDLLSFEDAAAVS